MILRDFLVATDVVETEISITHSECVPVALGIQHAMRMSRIILSSVACLVLSCFSTLSHKRYDFRKKKSWRTIICSNFIYKFV